VVAKENTENSLKHKQQKVKKLKLRNAYIIQDQ